MTPSRDVADLLRIMARLRDPDTGCAWDVKQTFASIAPYTVEEAYEVADAIERGDRDDLRDELGDLLFQVVYHARMAEERGWFGFGDVVEAITAKMVRRHPHVFGAAGPRSEAEVAAAWTRIKAEEKLAKQARPEAAEAEPPGVLDGVARSLPALVRAQKLSTRAAAVGFEWADRRDVLAKLHEELDEVERAAEGGDPDAVTDEVGDLLFTVVNLARHLRADAETALRGANAKFERRFRFIERALAADGRSPAGAGLAEMERLWTLAKEEEERAAPASQESRRAPE